MYIDYNSAAYGYTKNVICEDNDIEKKHACHNKFWAKYSEKIQMRAFIQGVVLH